MDVTLVTGVLGDDIHNIGVKVLEHALRNNGFKIVSLGIGVSQQEFIDAAIETKADAILVSSLSGHGRILSEGFRQRCTEAGLTDILMYIGGHLFIGDDRWEDVYRWFKDLGYDGVYPASALPEEVIAALKADFQERGKI